MVTHSYIETAYGSGKFPVPPARIGLYWLAVEPRRHCD